MRSITQSGTRLQFHFLFTPCRRNNFRGRPKCRGDTRGSKLVHRITLRPRRVRMHASKRTHACHCLDFARFIPLSKQLERRSFRVLDISREVVVSCRF